MKNLLTAIFIACVVPFTAWAQLNISGTVTENNTTRPLKGATVKLAGRTVATDANGRYQIDVQAGTHTLTATYIGFKTETRTINISNSQELNISLEQAVFIAEEVIVSATRAQGNSATTFKNMDKATLEVNNFGQDLPFLLDNTPGVVVTSDAGAGIGYTGIRIRGSDATRVNVTINGIPYNDSESQGTFWVNMPDFVSSVDNIQIQRGVGTSSNGAGSFGGSLNIQTSAVSDLPFAELNNSAGSFGTFKNTVKFGSGLINDKFSFEGRLSRIKSDGFIDRARADLRSYFLSGAFKTANHLLRANVFAGNETTYQAWNGIPEARLRGDVQGMNDYINRNGLGTADAELLRQSGNRTYNSFSYKDQTDNYWQNHYQLIYATNISKELTFNTALHYTAGRGYYEEFKADEKLADYGLAPVVTGGTTITNTDLVRRRWLDNNFYGLTYALQYQPSNILNLTLGGGYNEYKGDHFGQVIYAQFGSDGNNNRHYYDNRGDKSDFNIFGKLSIQPVQGLSLFADLQYRNINYVINGTDKNLNNLAIADDLHFFNPKLGVAYSINANQNIYASFSIAKKEPNRDDYINITSGFLPRSEMLKNVEAGYRLRTNTLNIGINGYGMFYNDQLVITGKVNDVGEYFRQNVAKSYRIGIELDAGYQINRQLLFNVNAAFSRNKIRDYVAYTDDYDNGGQAETYYANPDISFSPNIVAGAELAWQPAKGLAVALQGKYVGKQYLDNTQTASRSLNSYLVNNLRLGYDVSVKGLKNVNFGLLINNLFNRSYESNGYTFGYISGGATTVENFYFPQAGINFLGSINLKF